MMYLPHGRETFAKHQCTVDERRTASDEAADEQERRSALVRRYVSLGATLSRAMHGRAPARSALDEVVPRRSVTESFCHKIRRTG